MPDLNTCPSCLTSCLDPWHYEATMEEAPLEEQPCGCVPAAEVRRAG